MQSSPADAASTRHAGHGRGASPATVRAIAHASRRTGADFSVLMAKAQLESGFNPEARARTSSASGLFQFIDSTWLDTFARHGPAHGYGHLAAAIERHGGRSVVHSDSLRREILALRHDPAVASLMAGALTEDHRLALRNTLGREPDAGELYLAHFLGIGGARTMLAALDADPTQSAAALLSPAAAANRAIFFAGGRPRSVAELVDHLRGKVEAATGSAATPLPEPPAPFSSPRQAVPATRLASVRLENTGAQGRSMSGTLAREFGLAAEGVPGTTHVRQAYARLRAVGL
ncbi:lytic transglycosylase domain-containing protein [Qipengyuania thermophila]|uniref:lytic transglycosylase domain-containing protein n=1 Tax=Qipengyuania thermophila TaxID=2509361 RepID=UPI001F2AD995|nr:transglycosylase SLT domain-containing protein [Qipengyuania thermophila]